MNLLLVALASENRSSTTLARQCLTACAEVETEGHRVETLSLPQVWNSCFEPIEQLLKNPWDGIVVFAEKSGESIAIERIVINEADGSFKDDEGRRPRGKVIDPTGDAGYWTTLPYRELAKRFTSAKFPAVSSHSAGTGLANFVCYRLLRELAAHERALPVGLIQFPLGGSPFSKEQAETFLSVLLESLDPASLSTESLGLDMNRLSDRLQGEQRIH